MSLVDMIMLASLAVGVTCAWLILPGMSELSPRMRRVLFGLAIAASAVVATPWWLPHIAFPVMFTLLPLAPAILVLFGAVSHWSLRSAAVFSACAALVAVLVNLGSLALALTVLRPDMIAMGGGLNPPPLPSMLFSSVTDTLLPLGWVVASILVGVAIVKLRLRSHDVSGVAVREGR